MTPTKSPDPQLLSDHELLKPTLSTNFIAGLVLREPYLFVFIKSLVQRSKTFKSSNNVCFDGARTSDICRDSMSCEFLQDEVEAKYKGYVGVKRLMRPYDKALQHVEKINDEAAASDSDVRRGGLCITHLSSALLLESGNRDALHFVDAAAVHTKNAKKMKRTAALSSLGAFNVCVPRNNC